MTNLLRTIDRSETLLLERRGATVTSDTVSCDENTLVRSVGRFKSIMLGRRGQRGYHAKAVHFVARDRSVLSGPTLDTFLSCDSLACVDTADGAFSWSGWYKVTSSALFAYQAFFSCDPDNWPIAIMICVQNAVQAGFPDNRPYSDALFGSFPDNYQTSFGVVYPLDVWVHVIGCAVGNPNNADDAKLKVYMADVDVTAGFLPLNFAGAHHFQMPVNGKPFFIGTDHWSEQYRGDMADVWIAPGVNLLDNNGDIPLATRRKFITASGKPADPAGFPPSAILLTGDASSFTTNRGSGGAFSLVTNEFGGLTNASTSPSD